MVRPEILADVASITRAHEMEVVNHYNIRRVVDVYASVQDRDLGAVGRESVIALMLDPAMDEAEREHLVEGARKVFTQVRLAVRDWGKMIARLKEASAGLRANPPQLRSFSTTASIRSASAFPIPPALRSSR